MPEGGIGRNGSTKWQIISILSSEFPLSAKQVSKHVAKNSDRISYQAVHKALQELVADGTVEKHGRDFLLSSNWIDSLNKYAEDLKYRYDNNVSRTLDDRNFFFRTIHECDKFLLNTFLKIFASLQEEKPLLITHCRHAWLPLFVSRTEYRDIVNAFKSTECYGLIKEKTIVDKWCADFWIKNGVKVKFVSDVASLADVHVLGDYLVEVFYPSQVMQRMDEIYNNVKSISKLNMDDLFQSIFEMETDIVVTVNKNKQVADQIKEQTLSYFK